VEFIGKNNGNQRLNYLCIPPEDRWNKKEGVVAGDVCLKYCCGHNKNH
jgi:hypothetical protein